MGLGEKNGEELDQVKVALIPVFETNVPDEFVLGGHVVVSDHAAVPPRAELHSDVSSDKMVRERGREMRRSKVRMRVEGGRGKTKGLTDPIRVREGKEDVVATIVLDGGGEVETPGPVFCP